MRLRRQKTFVKCQSKVNSHMLEVKCSHANPDKVTIYGVAIRIVNKFAEQSLQIDTDYGLH